MWQRGWLKLSLWTTVAKFLFLWGCWCKVFTWPRWQLFSGSCSVPVCRYASVYAVLPCLLSGYYHYIESPGISYVHNRVSKEKISFCWKWSYPVFSGQIKKQGTACFSPFLFSIKCANACYIYSRQSLRTLPVVRRCHFHLNPTPQAWHRNWAGARAYSLHVTAAPCKLKEDHSIDSTRNWFILFFFWKRFFRCHFILS